MMKGEEEVYFVAGHEQFYHGSSISQNHIFVS